MVDRMEGEKLTFRARIEEQSLAQVFRLDLFIGLTY